VKNILDKELEPKNGTGIGYFITCPSKVIKKDIYSSKYIITKNFDYIYEDLNKKVFKEIKQGLALKKRNNTYIKSLENYFLQNDNTLILAKGFETLSYLNDILMSLESLGVCEYARNSIYFIEEKFCNKNIQAQQDGFIYYTLGALGVLLVSIGLNKISVFTGLVLKVFYIYYLLSILFFLLFNIYFYIYYIVFIN
jgi:hypothetical protein